MIKKRMAILLFWRKGTLIYLLSRIGFIYGESPSYLLLFRCFGHCIFSSLPLGTQASFSRTGASSMFNSQINSDVLGYVTLFAIGIYDILGFFSQIKWIEGSLPLSYPLMLCQPSTIFWYCVSCQSLIKSFTLLVKKCVSRLVQFQK